MRWCDSRNENRSQKTGDVISRQSIELLDGPNNARRTVTCDFHKCHPFWIANQMLHNVNLSLQKLRCHFRCKTFCLNKGAFDIQCELVWFVCARAFFSFQCQFNFETPTTNKNWCSSRNNGRFKRIIKFGWSKNQKNNRRKAKKNWWHLFEWVFFFSFRQLSEWISCEISD